MHLSPDVYNALTVHGLAATSPLPSSVLEVDKFWASTAYNIGGHVFSLDDMEHGVLRGDQLETGLCQSWCVYVPLLIMQGTDHTQRPRNCRFQRMILGGSLSSNPATLAYTLPSSVEQR